MTSTVLVGCGAMSAVWLEAVGKIDAVNLVGLVDIDLAKAKTCADEHGLTDVEIGTDLASVLSATRPVIVFDLTVPQARRDVVLTAFQHGCHVLTEKPLASSREDARAILAGAKAAGRLHAVGQNRRYVEGIRRIRRVIASGVLGRPTSMHCDFFIGPHFGGFREDMDNVLLLDMSIHAFDVARFLAGANARTVFCSEWEPSNSWYKSGSSAVAVFQMEHDIVFTYRGSWCAVGRKTSWEGAWRIVCERGTLTWDGGDDLSAECLGEGMDGRLDVVRPVDLPPLDPADRVGRHLGVIEDFVAAVRSGGTPETSGTDNIHSLAMVLGAVESAARGCQIPIET